MVPIYDTDLAEERFAQDQWKNYELADRTEARERKHRRIWISSAVLIFIALSALPPVIERAPKWQTMKAARVLSQRVDRLKSDAMRERMALSLKLASGPGLGMSVAKRKSCTEKASGQIETLDLSTRESLQWITETEAKSLGIPGLVDEVCFDPLKGFFVNGVLNTPDQRLSGIGVLPVEDLAATRVDRVSIVFFSGQEGAMSFE